MLIKDYEKKSYRRAGILSIKDILETMRFVKKGAARGNIQLNRGKCHFSKLWSFRDGA